MAGFGTATTRPYDEELLQSVLAGDIMRSLGIAPPVLPVVGANIPTTRGYERTQAAVPQAQEINPPVNPGPQLPPPAFPPGAQGAAAVPPVQGPVMPWIEQVRQHNPYRVPSGPFGPTPPATVEGSPVIQPILDLLTSQPGPAMAPNISAAVDPNMGLPAPDVPPPVTPGEFNQFPGGSLLQNLGISLPQLPGTGRPPASAGVGPGGSVPRSPSTPVAGPTSPSPAGPSGPSNDMGSSARAPEAARGTSRLMDTLAVIGTVLSQPPPPGGNIVSQIGRAMGMGFVYNKMLDSAEQEQGNTVKKQELEARKTGVQEAQLGINKDRVGLEGRRVAVDEAMAGPQIELLRERVRGTAAETRMREIELRYKNDPARRDLELRKLQADVAGTEARTDLTRNQIITAADKDAAALAKALKDAGAIDSMNPNGINWQAAAPVYNTFRYKPLNANEVAQAKAQFQKLTQGGMSPGEAERQINLWLTSPERRRVPLSLATPTR
jgi:hypothetical protein